MAEIVVTLKGRELRRCPIDKIATAVGRDMHNDLCLNNMSVSRRHAVLTFKDGAFWVENLSASNPVLVNEEAREGKLERGDLLRVGKFTLTVDWDGSPLTLDAPLAEPIRSRDIYQTTHLSPEDVQRMMGRVISIPEETQVEAPKQEAPRGIWIGMALGFVLAAGAAAAIWILR